MPRQYSCRAIDFESTELGKSSWNEPQVPISIISDFSITIQIQQKFHLAVIQLPMIILQQNFAHATTAQLSYHVQNFVAITSLLLGCEENEISIDFEFRWKNCSEMSPRSPFCICSDTRVVVTCAKCWLDWLMPGINIRAHSISAKFGSRAEKNCLWNESQDV